MENCSLMSPNEHDTERTLPVWVCPLSDAVRGERGLTRPRARGHVHEVDFHLLGGPVGVDVELPELEDEVVGRRARGH